jgi:hypothetical protein
LRVEAILSDVGGVIVRDDFTSFFAKYEEKIGMSAEAFYTSTVGSQEWKLYNKDFLDEEELWRTLAPKLRVEDEVARELREWRRMLIPISETAYPTWIKPRAIICRRGIGSTISSMEPSSRGRRA